MESEIAITSKQAEILEELSVAFLHDFNSEKEQMIINYTNKNNTKCFGSRR